MPYLSVGPDVRIFYEDFGEGIPVVFTHAGSSTHDMWEHQVDKLSQDFRCVTGDWRGVGLSDKPNCEYCVETLVGDLLGLIQGLGLDRSILVGRGLGSHAVMIAAARAPALMAGIGLVSTAPWCIGNKDGVEAGMSAEFQAWLKERMDSKGASAPAAYAAMFREWLFKNPPSDEEISAMVACAIQTPLYVINNYRVSLAQVDQRRRSKELQMPALIFQGRHDRKQRYGGAVHLQSLIPGSRLHTFEESAHMPHLEEMEAFKGGSCGFRPRAFVS